MRGPTRTAGTVIPAILAGLFATACGGSAPSGQGPEREAAVEAKASVPGRYIDITVQQLKQMMASEDLVLVNVHTPHGDDIAGTDLAIPYDEIGHRAGEIPGDKDAKIVLYCRSGHMSAKAAETLVSFGYTNVYSLTGGMEAWNAAGL